jgi:uncharacterized protein (DUF362 family)
MDPKELTRRQLLREAAGLAAAASAGAVAGCSLDSLFPNAGGQWATSMDPLCAAEGDDGGADAEAGSSTSTAAVTSTGDSGAGADGGGAPLGPIVVSVERDDSITQPNENSPVQVDPAVVQSMLDTALSTLAGSVDNPWSVLLPDYAPGMRIGLKVNGLSQDLGTHAELISAVINSLVTHLGVDPSTQVIVWELFGNYMTTKPGYSSTAFSGAQILGTTNSNNSNVPNASGGPGYRPNPCAIIQGSPYSTPRLSRILTDLTDVTINMPLLKTHYDVAGLTGALKNVYGMIDIPGSYHLPYALQAIPQIYALPPIRKSIRLTILDALQAVVLGHTTDTPTVLSKTLLVSQDPVALDTYAVQLLNQCCLANPAIYGGPQHTVPTNLLGWLSNAEALGLGTQQYNLISV